MEYLTKQVSELTKFTFRGIRPAVVEKLKERMSEGYNPARPITITADGMVIDGNHRVEAARLLGIKELPCLMRTGDPYKIAAECNADEDTYAPMDLFDWLDVITALKSAGVKSKDIALKIGWSAQKVSDYSNLTKISASVMELAKQYQSGRADGKYASADFTEGWFRSSGICDIEEKYQTKLFESFKADKFNWNKAKVQTESAKYKLWQDMAEAAEKQLTDENDLESVVAIIEAGALKTMQQLEAKVADMNKKAANKFICGDCRQVLQELENGSIDIVLTDPPYGIDYISNRSKYADAVTNEGVYNDGRDEAMPLLDEVCGILKDKTKTDAHLYFFCGWQTEPEFRAIIGKYFDVKNVIIWNKGNHGVGDLDCSWGNKYEMIIFAIKGRKKLQSRPADIIEISKINSSKMIHPTQKPVELLSYILKASACKADVVCDPFAGSGSTLKAVKERGDLNYVGVELDKTMFERAKAFIGGDNE
jgi:DNA modification methylase